MPQYPKYPLIHLLQQPMQRHRPQALNTDVPWPAHAPKFQVSVDRTRPPGHAVALCGAPEGRVELKRRGFKFVGPSVVHGWMQAVGIVNDHAPGCFLHGRG